MSSKLKCVFLIGRDSPSVQSVIARVCELKGVETAAVLVDAEEDGAQRRWRNLKRNVRREGLGYPFYRLLGAVRAKLEAWADKVASEEEVEELLRKAFPERGLATLAGRYGFRVVQTGNLNGDKALRALRDANADLGIVLGARILKRPVFEIPRLGCINLHKGKVPDYRGMPPGFWELYEGEKSAGVTVHFVDAGLDTGDVLGTSEVAIHPKETPESLRTKLDYEGERLMVEVVGQLCQGTAQRRPQPKGSHKTRTRPTRAQQQELARRLPHWRRMPDLSTSIKLAFWLAIFHSGIFKLVQRLRKSSSRGAILLYHRVNDMSEDVLTTNTRRFAQHLVAVRRYYHPVPTAEIIEKVATHQRIESTSVAIHFDDCYRDVRSCAAPLLAAAGIPGTAFVSSGFVDTDRVFGHDREKYPHRFENFRETDLRELPGLGVEVAAHTVNHVDLGTVTLEQARVEVLDSRKQLEEMLNRPVLLFSFPFGQYANIREDVRQLIQASGYQALFSAYGGFVNSSTSLFDIPRFGVSSDHSPLALLMELEGISPANFRHWLHSRRQARLNRPTGC